MSIKADATLVNAAYRMGMANIPADTSKLFQRQFKAVADMHIAQMETVGTGILAGINIMEKKDQARKWQQAYDQLSVDLLKESSSFINDNYKNGKGPDKDTVEAAKQEIIDIKDQIETLKNMPGNR